MGLGNPGRGYRETRHNVGFQVVNLLSRELGVRLKDRRFQSRNIRTKLDGKEVIVLRPATFMNHSGKSVKACADFYQIETEHILVIHDDLDLPVGRIKVVGSGGSGGHKGIQSIIEHLGKTRFPRVKIGIGRPHYQETTEDYVLSPFYDDERTTMERVRQLAVQACRLFVSKGVDYTMNCMNRKNFEGKEVKS